MKYKKYMYAIDSLPISCNITNSWDYSGVQLNSLSSLSLKNILDKEPERASVSMLEVKIDLSELNHRDGSHILPGHFIEGITQVLKNNPIIYNIFKIFIRSIESEKSSLIVKSHKNCSQLLELLMYPNFVAVSKCFEFDLDYGEIEHGFFEKKHWNLTNAKCRKGIHSQLSVICEKSGDKNYELYMKGLLDCTADTTFTAELVQEIKHRQDYYHEFNGLFAYILVGEKLKKNLGSNAAENIANIFRVADYGLIDSEYWSKTESFFIETKMIYSKTISLKNKIKDSIQIVYDDYYPNKIVCEIMKSCIEREFSVDCNLVVDDYYNPSKPFDIRFCIGYFLANSPFLRACTIFHSCTDKSSNTLTLLNLINEKNFLPYLYDINRVISNTSSIAPLFRVDSHYLSRNGRSLMTAPFTLRKFIC
jgi:hypothetical protein